MLSPNTTNSHAPLLQDLLLHEAVLARGVDCWSCFPCSWDLGRLLPRLKPSVFIHGYCTGYHLCFSCRQGRLPLLSVPSPSLSTVPHPFSIPYRAMTSFVFYKFKSLHSLPSLSLSYCLLIKIANIIFQPSMFAQFDDDEAEDKLDPFEEYIWLSCIKGCDAMVHWNKQLLQGNHHLATMALDYLSTPGE